MSKISQELLRLGFWNLVQMLGMTCCIMKKRISLLGTYHCLICPFFFLSKQIFCYRFLSFYESQSSNCVYTLRVAKYIVGQKTKLIFILPSFSFFPFLTQFVTNISQELLRVGFYNLVQVLWIICCFMWKRTRFLLHILLLISSCFFLSSFQIKKNHLSFLRDWEVHKVETWSTHGQ